MNSLAYLKPKITQDARNGAGHHATRKALRRKINLAAGAGGVSISGLIISAAVWYGTVNQTHKDHERRIDTNTRAIDAVREDQQRIGEDVSWIRGFLEQRKENSQ